jgi:hypothetical protein
VAGAVPCFVGVTTVAQYIIVAFIDLNGSVLVVTSFVLIQYTRSLLTAADHVTAFGHKWINVRQGLHNLTSSNKLWLA